MDWIGERRSFAGLVTPTKLDFEEDDSSFI